MKNKIKLKADEIFYFQVNEQKSICVRVCQVTSVMSNSVNLWTIAHQAPPSMEYSRQEY